MGGDANWGDSRLSWGDSNYSWDGSAINAYGITTPGDQSPVLDHEFEIFTEDNNVNDEFILNVQNFILYSIQVVSDGAFDEVEIYSSNDGTNYDLYETITGGGLLTAKGFKWLKFVLTNGTVYTKLIGKLKKKRKRGECF